MATPTFTEIYKKTGTAGTAADYQVVAQVGVGGVPLAVMKGASSSAAGVQGLVPAPASGAQAKYLRGDGTWQTPPYPGTASTSSNGLMTSTMVSTLNSLNTKIGSIDISTIGDGTVTGAITKFNNDIGDTRSIGSIGDGTVADAISTLNTKMGRNNISTIGDGTVTGAIRTLNSNIINIDGKEIGRPARFKTEYFECRNTDLPYDFSEGSALVYNNNIHILGSSIKDCYTKHYKWNGSSWTRVSTLPYNFYAGSAVVYNDEIHILGADNENSMKHYKLDLSSATWTEVSTLPKEFSVGSAVVYNDEIHILGWDSSIAAFHYKWDGSSWTEASTLPYIYHAGSAVVYNDEIHILGGLYRDDTIQTMYLHYKWDGSSWTKVSTLPKANSKGSAVVYNDEIHILSSIHHLKWDGSSWTDVSTLPYNVASSNSVVYNDLIYILGGRYSAGTCKYSYRIYPLLMYL